ncbi:MAG: type II toxin-antitoxin system HicA family toxin [Chloroflexi bacterium]|nr:type II toxin-antitoxin system HicA family toxin [Chloroflexota bacterium]
MPPLPRISGNDVLRLLLRNGYRLSHVRGSHHFLRKSNADPYVIIPVHGNRILPPGTLKSILNQAELSVEAFMDLVQNE